MKKSNIILLVVIGITLVMLMTFYKDAGSYETFTSKKTISGQKVHVVGFYDKEAGITYKPEEDPNYFSFYLTDTLGTRMNVFHFKGVPQDFDKSERVVVIGKMANDTSFFAEDLLLKCPSKYIDEQGIERNMPGYDGAN